MQQASTSTRLIQLNGIYIKNLTSWSAEHPKYQLESLHAMTVQRA